MANLFVSGTDTGVGKTMVTGLIAKEMASSGRAVATQKWVQTGATEPEDIYTHDQICGLNPDPAWNSLRCPYLFPLPASPHLAAKQAQETISVTHIEKCYTELSQKTDMVIVEGAGGLMVPLNESILLIDLAEKFHLKVVVVVENRVGCINQALLSIEALKSRNMAIVGIVMNQCQPTLDSVIATDNATIISQISSVPILASLPYFSESELNYNNLRNFNPFRHSLAEFA